MGVFAQMVALLSYTVRPCQYSHCILVEAVAISPHGWLSKFRGLFVNLGVFKGRGNRSEPCGLFSLIEVKIKDWDYLG